LGGSAGISVFAKGFVAVVTAVFLDEAVKDGLA